MTEDSEPGPLTEETVCLTLDDGPEPLYARKIVSRGERLAFSTDTNETKLDALLLEGLSWQREQSALQDSLPDGSEIEADPIPTTGGDPVTDTPKITISNEYAHITARKVNTKHGVGLRIVTSGRGTAITLGVTTLRALTELEDMFNLSPWFETPVGPEDVPIEGPL